jgi:hypothetical protein
MRKEEWLSEKPSTQREKRQTPFSRFPGNATLRMPRGSTLLRASNEKEKSLT